MRALTIILGLAVTATTIHADPDPAARKAAEQLMTDANASHDDAKYVACGKAFLDLYNKDPQASGADEIVYNAAVCYQLGRSIGMAIQLDNLLIKNHPSSRLAGKALLGLAMLYARIGFVDQAADKFESYARKYAGEKDAVDALENAIRYRTALGDAQKRIELTKLFVRTFGRKQVQEAGAAMLALTSAYDGAPDDQIKHLQEVLKTFGGKLDTSQQLQALSRLGELLWAKSCPVAQLDGLCVTLDRPRKPLGADARCGGASIIKVAVTKRTVVAKEAQAVFKQIVDRAASEKDASARHAAAMAKLALADADLEGMLDHPFPADLSFDPDPKHKAAKEKSLKRFNEWIAEESKLGADLDDRYTAIIEERDGPGVIAATARVGQVVQAFWRALLVGEIPKDVKTGKFARDKLDAYCDQMRAAAEPLAAKAAQAFAVCLQKSTELGVYDGWARLCWREEPLMDPTFPRTLELFADPAVTALPAALAPASAAHAGAPADLTAALAKFAAAEKAGWSDKTCRSVADAFGAVARKQPKLADAQYMAGLSLHRCGLAAEARKAYEAALAAAPDHVAATVNLGELAWRAGHRDEARKAWDAAVARDGKHYAAQLDVTLDLWTQLRANPKDKQLDGDLRLHASSAMAIDTEPGARVLLAASQLDTPQLRELARLLLEEAIQLDDKYATAYLVRGVLSIKRGDWTLGLADLDRAAALDPRNEAALLAAGLAELRIGRFDAANKLLAAIKTPSYDLAVARGVVARGLGDRTGAVAAYKAAIALDGARAEAHYDLGVFDELTVAPKEKDARALKAALTRAAESYRRAAAIDSKLDAQDRATAIDKQLAALP